MAMEWSGGRIKNKRRYFVGHHGELFRPRVPNEVVIATSAASLPVAISTRPIRGLLFRASKVHQRLSKCFNHALKSIGGTREHRYHPSILWRSEPECSCSGKT